MRVTVRVITKSPKKILNLNTNFWSGSGWFKRKNRLRHLLKTCVQFLKLSVTGLKNLWSRFLYPDSTPSKKFHFHLKVLSFIYSQVWFLVNTFYERSRFLYDILILRDCKTETKESSDISVPYTEVLGQHPSHHDSVKDFKVFLYVVRRLRS